MRNRTSSGNSAAVVNAENPTTSERETPDFAMSKNGLLVRIGSIIKYDGDVGQVTYLENDSFIAKTMEFDSERRIAGYCEDCDVLSNLAAMDAESPTGTTPGANLDTNGEPIRVGDIVCEEGNPDVVGRVEVVHDGGLIYRVLSGGDDNKATPGKCHGFQCSDMILQLPREKRPLPLHAFNDGKTVAAVKKLVDEIREKDPTVDQTGRPIKIGDIVCIDGPEYGRVEHIKEGCVLIRMFNWQSPDTRKLVDWACDDCTIVDEAGQ